MVFDKLFMFFEYRCDSMAQPLSWWPLEFDTFGYGVHKVLQRIYSREGFTTDINKCERNARKLYE